MISLRSKFALFLCPVWKPKSWWKRKPRGAYMKTEVYKLYSRAFWIFLPNGIKIEPYNFELYHFKFSAYFETQCMLCLWVYFCDLYCFLFFCLSVTVKWLAVKTATKMTYTVSGGALNSAQSNPILVNYQFAVHCINKTPSIDWLTYLQFFNSVEWSPEVIGTDEQIPVLHTMHNLALYVKYRNVYKK